MKLFQLFILLAGFILSNIMYPSALYAQETATESNLLPLYTAFPILTIPPDARTGGIGEAGVASEPDVYSQFRNPAKYPFSYSNSGVAFSYTPWLRRLANDMGLIYLVGYKQWGENQQQAISGSIRYFSIGEINGIKDEMGNSIPPLRPYEMALDAAYSRKLSPYASFAVSFRYSRSDMGVNIGEERYAANAFSVDIAGYGEKYFLLQQSECLWSWGIHLSDIGTRVSYDGGATQSFLPALLKAGTGILYPLSASNHLGVYFDIHKYLVPSFVEDNSMSSIKGAIKSFSDAPGGFREELQELILAMGAEYSYQNRLFFRTGYYHQNKKKGNRQYATFGTGIRIQMFMVDVSYLVTTGRDNPLDQTLRLSLCLEINP